MNINQKMHSFSLPFIIIKIIFNIHQNFNKSITFQKNTFFTITVKMQLPRFAIGNLTRVIHI